MITPRCHLPPNTDTCLSLAISFHSSALCVGGSSHGSTEACPVLSFLLISLLAEFPAQGDRQKKADPPVSVCDDGSKDLRAPQQGLLLRAGGPPAASFLCQRGTTGCGAGRVTAHIAGWLRACKLPLPSLHSWVTHSLPQPQFPPLWNMDGDSAHLPGPV